MPQSAKVSALQAALEPLTGILARKQKLISRGKVPLPPFTPPLCLHDYTAATLDLYHCVAPALLRTFTGLHTLSTHFVSTRLHKASVNRTELMPHWILAVPAVHRIT